MSNSNFDTSGVDKLAAAEFEKLPEVEQPSGLDIDELKKGFEEAGMSFAVVPSMGYDHEGYAVEYDLIAILEKRILGFEDQIEDLEANKRVIENAVRWEVEILAEDKDNKLTNETKRQLKYDSIIECNDEFQRLSGDLKVFRREVRKLRIELYNEKRAFQLILRKGASV